MSTVREALRKAGQILKDSGAVTPALDAGVLLGHVTGRSHAGLYRDWESELTPEAEARFFMLIARREAGEPVAYLTGCKEFMGLDFTVNNTVLIPRPETELLVETAIHLAGNDDIIVDVGTGCGAIAVSLAVFLPHVVIYATDLSPDAIETARHNAVLHGVGQRVSFLQGDLLVPLAGLELAGRVDLVTANLPYIATSELGALSREVQLEPVAALDGGADGLDLYRRLIPAAAELLKPGGRLMMEIGSSQREAIAALLSPSLWETVFLQDLAGLDRLAVARLSTVVSSQ
ncbi:peptide chain release factor N(5)-glutamine methyltransferase [Pelotomaculum isophthalicicum JI]|uniref:Release factor glutamine methyltransferase n=1 Tax=Pelotomaculum isophthalicicum JI TaxID=947010 RepID=A0A9X4H0Y9_9FIRM|nr:peptide chain release factor N(5)-glutamine methyltransferase [Pelotomaculum isophthalicicum]MDF9407620.1 peptide chain release factor N(5)-glutamine methyltransferase [Pelotomaculum isophthalicicum JI]